MQIDFDRLIYVLLTKYMSSHLCLSICLLGNLEPLTGKYEQLRCTIESPDYIAGSARAHRSIFRAQNNVRGYTLWYQLFLTDKAVALSKTLNNELMAFSPSIDVADVICGEVSTNLFVKNRWTYRLWSRSGWWHHSSSRYRCCPWFHPQEARTAQLVAP